jgi:hypothetical protein
MRGAHNGRLQPSVANYGERGARDAGKPNQHSGPERDRCRRANNDVEYRGEKPSKPSKPSEVQSGCGFLALRGAVPCRPRAVQPAPLVMRFLEPPDGGRVRVLYLEPVWRTARPVRCTQPFRYDALTPQPASVLVDDRTLAAEPHRAKDRSTTGYAAVAGLMKEAAN